MLPPQRNRLLTELLLRKVEHHLVRQADRATGCRSAPIPPPPARCECGGAHSAHPAPRADRAPIPPRQPMHLHSQTHAAPIRAPREPLPHKISRSCLFSAADRTSSDSSGIRNSRVNHHAQQRTPPRQTRAIRQLRIIRQHRSDSRQNGVRRMPQPLHIRRAAGPVSQCGSGPVLCAADRRKFAIHRDRRLQRHKRPLMLDRKREGVIQPPRPPAHLGIGWSNQHLDCPQRSSAPIPCRDQWIRIKGRHDTARDSGRYQGVRARPGTPMMNARSSVTHAVAP